MISEIIEACEQEWPANKGDCSGYARAVCRRLGIVIPDELAATGIVEWLRGPSSGFSRLADGVEAKARADAGALVVAGLRGPDHNPPREHGHLVIVVSGPLAHGRYPTAYWGTLGGTGMKSTPLNYAWTSADRDRVAYFQSLCVILT